MSKEVTESVESVGVLELLSAGDMLTVQMSFTFCLSMFMCFAYFVWRAYFYMWYEDGLYKVCDFYRKTKEKLWSQ